MFLLLAGTYMQYVYLLYDYMLASSPEREIQQFDCGFLSGVELALPDRWQKEF